MGKKSKDPFAPKPPLNSYMEFAADERSKIVAELGQVSTKEIGREAGLRWKNLSEEDKKKYVEKSRLNQQQYMMQKEVYEKNRGVEPRDCQPNRKKKKRNPLAPKLPLSSYMEFAREQRTNVLAEFGKLSLSEVGRELGKRWQSLSKDEKEKYELKSKENRARYEAEMKAFTDQEETDLEDDGGVTSTKDNSSSSENHGQESSAPEPIKLEQLGFAKQKGFNWHPALKNSVLARGTRVKVTFFGTGEAATVDKKDWVVFSEQSLARISSPKLTKTVPFQAALGQMKSLREKVLGDMPVTSSGIGFTPLMGSRRLKSLDKDHLVCFSIHALILQYPAQHLKPL